jgi:hypothetical protein
MECISLLTTFQGLELSHMTTPNCKGTWETESSHVFRRNGRMNFGGQLDTYMV